MAVLQLIGLNNRTASIALRERLAVAPRDLPALLSALRQGLGVREAAVLSTCNRVEYYLATADPSATYHDLIGVLSHRSHLTPKTIESTLYCLRERDAVTHLFRVAAGLESMILGESEIIAQVKQAYELARAHGATGPTLNRLFQKTLHASKIIRSHTRIAEGQASIGSVVVALSRRIFTQGLSGCQVLLWGAGKAAETTARHLAKHGVQHLSIVNRTQLKAQDLASLCRGGWLSWEHAIAHLAHIDLAIVCTQAPHYVVDVEDLPSFLPQRRGRPLVMVDLAVPRNVDPALKPHPGIHLYDMDDLQTIAQDALARREGELDRCEALIQEQAGHFVKDGLGRSLEPSRM